MNSSLPPGSSVALRLTSVMFTPMYLLWIGNIYAAVTDQPLGLCLLRVVGLAGTISVVLAVLGERLYRSRRQERRFSLATVMLGLVPLAIYLAALRELLRYSGVSAEATWFLWLVLFVVYACWVVFSTALLLVFTDAIVWLGLACLRVLRRRL